MGGSERKIINDIKLDGRRRLRRSRRKLTMRRSSPTMLPQERVGCLTVDGAVEESYEEDEPLHQKLIKAKLAKKQAAEDARLLEARL